MNLPTDLVWTTDRPTPLRPPLKAVPWWFAWLPDWLRHQVPWSVLDWFDSRYATCWVEVVGWKLNGGARDRDFGISTSCHGDTRRCGRCYCNKIRRADGSEGLRL